MKEEAQLIHRGSYLQDADNNLYCCTVESRGGRARSDSGRNRRGKSPRRVDKCGRFGGGVFRFRELFARRVIGTFAERPSVLKHRTGTGMSSTGELSGNASSPVRWNITARGVVHSPGRRLFTLTVNVHD